jgi:hypothetical protein
MGITWLIIVAYCMGSTEMNKFKEEFASKFREFAHSRLAGTRWVFNCDAISSEEYQWMLASMQEFIDENYKEKE